LFLTVAIVVINLFFTVESLVVALIPLWVFLLLNHLVNQEGFWQVFLLFGYLGFFAGRFQLTL
jgi:hypothetical protein